MSIDKESIIEVILRARSDLSREDILRMVEEKRKRIGAGYLTEQGALFLVAADLGVKVDNIVAVHRTLEIGLKDLYSGARDVNFTVRIMKIYPLKRYSRSDGSQSMLRVITVYDNDKVMRMNLWDDHAGIVDKLRLNVGDAIRVTRVNIKSLLDGSLVINTSSNTTLEKLEYHPYIKKVDELAIDVDDLLASIKDKNISSDTEFVVNGILASNPIIASYANRDGGISRVLRFILQGYNGSKIRVVIWDLNDSNVARIIPLNTKITVIGVKVKDSNSNNNSSSDSMRIELHGDAGSVVRLAYGYEHYDNDAMDVMQFDVIAVSHDNRYAIVSDTEGNLLLLDIQRECMDRLNISIQEGSRLECIPSKILGYTVYLNDESYARIKDNAYHESEITPTKISEIKEEDKLYIVEGIVLTNPSSSDIRRKDGSNVKYSEMIIGDDTKEAKVVAWNRQAPMLEMFKVGERIRIYGIVARRSREKSIDYHATSINDLSFDYELLVKPFTVIKGLS